MSSRTGQHKDSRRILAHSDQIANADSVIDPYHKRVHNKEYWRYDYVDSVPAGGAIGLRIVNQTADVLPYHMRFTVAMGGLAAASYAVRLYEDATFESTLELQDPVNHYRVFDAAPGIRFDEGPSFSGGVLLFQTLCPAAHKFESKEWIMDQINAPEGDAFIELTNLNSGTSFLFSIAVDFYLGTGQEGSAR